MEHLPFVLAVLIRLIGPSKAVQVLAGMKGADSRFKRKVAIRGVVIAAVLCVFVALAGGAILDKYRISVDALRIAGALVLLINALHAIFPTGEKAGLDVGARSALQIAASPVAVPSIVPPAGVAVIMLLMTFEPQYAGIRQAVAICVSGILVLDFLAMYFVDRIMRTPGVTIVLPVLGSVLLFLQVAMAIEMALHAFVSLGVIGS